MFDWIWHLRGSFALRPGLSTESILEQVEEALDRQGKSAVRRSATAIEFNDPLWSSFFQANWPALAFYDHGRTWISESADRPVFFYDMRSLHGLVFCLCAAAMFALVGVSEEGPAIGLKLGLGSFAWLYGMNVLITLVRVPLFFRRIVRAS